MKKYLILFIYLDVLVFNERGEYYGKLELYLNKLSHILIRHQKSIKNTVMIMQRGVRRVQDVGEGMIGQGGIGQQGEMKECGDEVWVGGAKYQVKVRMWVF